MKTYLAIYLGSAAALAQWKSADEPLRKEREQAGFAEWMKWTSEHAKSILDHGSPLGKTKRIGVKGISDTKNEITAYTVVQAESHEAAAQLFVNHPHFMIFPGDSIELMEFLPLPTM